GPPVPVFRLLWAAAHAGDYRGPVRVRQENLAKSKSRYKALEEKKQAEASCHCDSLEGGSHKGCKVVRPHRENWTVKYINLSCGGGSGADSTFSSGSSSSSSSSSSS
ncbi:hypothetical protein EGW08_006034, partial [Elysia chlorotica]